MLRLDTIDWIIAAEVLVFSLSISACTSVHAVDDSIEKPNIILVFLDDAGYADFGVTGSATPTPTIDALATQ